MMEQHKVVDIAELRMPLVQERAGTEVEDIPLPQDIEAEHNHSDRVVEKEVEVEQ